MPDSQSTLSCPDVDTAGTVRPRSAISSSSGSSQIAIGGSSSERGQVHTGTKCPPLLEPRQDTSSGLWRLAPDDLHDGLLELFDDPQVDQRPRDVQLEAELLADFPSELQDDIRERPTVRARLAGLLHCPGEFLIDHLLDSFGTGTGGELLFDDRTGLFKRDD